MINIYEKIVLAFTRLGQWITGLGNNKEVQSGVF